MKNFSDFKDNKRRITDVDHMKVAVELASHARSNGDYPVGAVLAWAGGRTISEHDTRYTDHNPLNYAIVNVINKAIDTLGQRRLSEAVLYTTVEPNLMCALMIQEAGIKEVVFGVYDDLEGFSSSKMLAEEVVLDVSVIGGVLGKECSDLLPGSIREHFRYE